MAQAVNYWQQIQSVLAGQEAYVIINLGNEPWGNLNTANWVNDTKNAIAQMRRAGFRHTLMVDAPNWGQDWQHIMLDNAAGIFNSDPDRNTVFSIHMYSVFDTPSKVQDYLSAFVNNALPLVIGEFGPLSPDGNPDEDTIMAQAQAHGIGYLAWSWSGNGSGLEYLDMVTNFDPKKISSWGNRVIQGTHGLTQTSQEASVYGAACDIQLNKTTFVNGDSVIAQVARLANTGSNAVPVEVKLWFEVPGSPPVPFFSTGADGSFVLTKDYNKDFGPLRLATVQASFPRGPYSFNCRLLHAVTGAFLSEGLNQFQIQ